MKKILNRPIMSEEISFQGRDSLARPERCRGVFHLLGWAGRSSGVEETN